MALVEEHPDDEVRETVHAVNAEMVLRIAEAKGRAVHSEELDEHWIEVVFSPSRAERLP